MRLIASKCWATIRLMWLTGRQVQLQAVIMGWSFMVNLKTIWRA